MIQNLKLKSKCINTLKEYEGDIIIVAAEQLKLKLKKEKIELKML